MTIKVKGPGGVIVAFPDGTDRETIRRAMIKKFGGPTREAAAALPQEPSLGAKFLGILGQTPAGKFVSQVPGAIRNINEGMTFGYGDEGAAAIEAAFGNPRTGEFFDYSEPFSARYQSGLEREKEKRLDFARSNPPLSAALELGGALTTGHGLTKGGVSLLDLAKSPMARTAAGATEGGLFGALYGSGKAEPGNRAEGAAQGGLIGAATGGILTPAADMATKALAQSGAAKKLASAAAAEGDLKARSGKLYKAAENAGVRFSPDHVKLMSDGFKDYLKQNSIMTPTGAIHSIKKPGGTETYGALKTFLSRLDDYAETGMTPTNIMALREDLMAAASQGGREARAAVKILNGFDSVTEKIAPTIKRANALYRNAKKAEQLENMVEELAPIRAGQYSQSGMENSLRTEFRQLARRISKGKEKGWTPDEYRIIKEIASNEDRLRDIGKYTKGPLAEMAKLSLATSVGIGAGSTPVGIATFLAAEVGASSARKIVTALQNQRAQMAINLAKSGGALPPMATMSSAPVGAAGGFAGGQAAGLLDRYKGPQ